MNDPMIDQAAEGCARVELERSQFPHLTEFEWDALHRLATASSEAVVSTLLMQGTPDQHREAAQGFLARELADARQRVSTPASARKEDVVKLDVSKYSGEGSKRLALSRWFCEVDLACEAHQLRSEFARSYFLLSNLTDKAREWALGKQMADPSCFRMMDALKDDLRRAFEPVQDETQQRAAFLKLKQGKLPMRDYIQLARHLASCIVKNPMDSVTQVHVFVSGMNAGYQRFYLTRKPPASLEEAFDIALREDYNVQASNTFLFPVSSSMGPEPMEVDAIQESRACGSYGGRGRGRGRHDPSRQQRPVVCYRCQKPGHRASECRAPALVSASIETDAANPVQSKNGDDQ